MFAPDPSLPADAGVPAAEPAEFEFVLGRRQVASVSLVLLAAVGIFTTAAYMAGKSAVPVSAAAPVAVTPPPAAPPQPAPEPAAEPKPLPEAPLFASPEKDGRYLQLGSVERGFAILMVHGARKVGYPAFVANGTNPNVFRVLVGPFPDKAQYDTAKAMFSTMGLDIFVRTYGAAAESDSAETREP
jgi:cell division septation protein DedD